MCGPKMLYKMAKNISLEDHVFNSMLRKCMECLIFAFKDVLSVVWLGTWRAIRIFQG
jgi:hypothetical protein